MPVSSTSTTSAKASFSSEKTSATNDAKQDVETPLANPGQKWIRGVNIGGWLVLERYITPYQVCDS